ncbi:MAG TPA: NAD(P)-binding domain-containing protein, partial [Polyangiaceae bacterium]|nr:NAD(P)-binding domain-containing protein [Polyangiaceae bacterium]
MSPRLAIIGAGFMGEALVKGLLKNGKFGPGDISMADPDEKRRRRIEAEYGIGVFADNVRAVEGADMVALCIKGQSLDAVASTLRGAIPAACSVVSVLPGVSIETLRSKFGTAAVARLMPNLGSGIGEGFTVWTTSGEMPEVSREWVTNIVQSLG